MIDWITPARLCTAFRGSTAPLRDAGVRPIVDLENLGDKGLLADIAKRSGVDEIWIRSVYELARDGPDQPRARSRLRPAAPRATLGDRSEGWPLNSACP